MKIVYDERYREVDIDLHYGDGTANIFAENPDVSYFHVKGVSRQQYLTTSESI